MCPPCSSGSKLKKFIPKSADTKVAGKNNIVTMAIVFIAAPSSFVAIAMSTFVFASSWVMRFDVCHVND